MSRNKMTRCLIVIGLLIGGTASAAGVDGLGERFANPPEATKPRCYWYWINGQISKEGITKDLEAMRRVGIGEAYIGIMGGSKTMTPPGDGSKTTEPLSEEWWQLHEHAIREGTRLGVDIGLFNSPGWSQSGGPWVKPEQTMRYVVLPETRLKGPQHFEGKLPAPAQQFQDVAVIAFPVPAEEGRRATITRKTPEEIQFEMPSPFTARSLTIRPAEAVKTTAELQVSDDGQNYRPLKAFPINRMGWINTGPVPLAPVAVSFPATAARYFRLKFSKPCKMGDIQLSPAAKVEYYAEKSLLKMYEKPLPSYDYYTWPQQPEPNVPVIPTEGVVNLGGQMSADGTLRWDVPAGEWIVLRAGMVPTGVFNGPAPKEATGPEVDKMSRTALKAHFDSYMGKLLRRLPEAERKSWKHVVVDSWEKGSQNWTDDFVADFQKRYGYDPLKWLPALSGRVVGSVDLSDRFLWDLRRMVADRIVEDYVGGFRDLCHEHGLKIWLENYGHCGFPSEFLKYAGASDEIGGEFWPGLELGRIEVRAASSAAHIYGKPVVYSEAFTWGPVFQNTPRDLKALGDWALCEGINQFVLHVYIHQPDERRPGINAAFGTEFNRHNTWFGYAKPWIDYQRRCSVMLQAGVPVADVAYFITEDTPKMTGLCKPALPAGHDYDYINADVIENRLAVRNGRFVLPDGTSYRLLVLPDSETMRPALLKKLQKLAADGGAVLGSAPERSPSMAGYPACDAEVKKLAGEVWGSGRVMTGDRLEEAFKKLNLSADVICPQDILWKHRQDGETDIYFLSNEKNAARTELVSFRVDGRMPELWWPETGRVEEAPAFNLANGRVEVPINFDVNTSVFVLFRKKADAGRVAVTTPPVKTSEIVGPWTLEFPGKQVKLDTLASWTQNADPAIKYFSGEATYRNTFQVGRPQSGITLDLGTVHSIAKVFVNGQEVGIVWKEPYSLDISKAVKPGANELAITVVNAWNNRLVGDAQPGIQNPQTFLTDRTIKSSTPLMPAGLLGPVMVRQAK